MTIPAKSVARLLPPICTVFIFAIAVAIGGAADEPKIRNQIGMEFVRIPAGSFHMGSPMDEPNRGTSEIPHPVRISRPFYLQTTEVTLGQWRRLMGKRWLSRRRGANHMPVARVSWHDCMAFIAKLNRLGEGRYRLPTEAEWEYACRAGTRTAFSWGNRIDCSRAMFENNRMKAGRCISHVHAMGLRPNRPAPVQSYAPNPWGLYDMHGNLWEWCQDWYGPYPDGEVTDPVGPADGTMRIKRGGSWFKFGRSCRAANRAAGHPASRFKTTGFRVLREIP